MRKEASLEEWRELYEVAIKIKELKPWEHLWDLDLFTLLLPDSEPIVSSIMGKGGEFFGVGSYVGSEAISKFFDMLNKKNIPPEQMFRYQDDNVLMCYFGDREELTAKERKIIKDLGLKFRGKGNWIYFHSFKKGYAPYILDQDEVLQETEILKNLYMSLRSYIEIGLEVDFEGGNTLLRLYDSERDEWLNFESPIMFPEPEYMTPVIEDELLIANLKKQEQNKNIWEMDISYLGSFIRDKEYERPVNSRICVLAERKSGVVINQDMFYPIDDDIQVTLNMLISSIMRFGRPSKILVRDECFYHILKDLCERIKIKLEIKERLRAIDSFLTEFSKFGL